MAAVAVLAMFNVFPAASAQGADQHFTSPAGSVDCMLYLENGEAIADCLVQEATWKNPPAQDPNCDLDWFPNEVVLTSGINNNNVAVSTIAAGWCRGDIGPLCGPGECNVLKYGAKVILGNIVCTSAKSGITCATAKGLKRSFTVSKSTYKIVKQR